MLVALRRQNSSLPPWAPSLENKPQRAATYTPADVTLYAGKPFGGKTNLLLGLARTQHRNSLLIRESYPELDSGMIPDSKRFYGDERWFNENRRTWDIPGKIQRRVRFGYGCRQKDFRHYKGPDWDFIGIDEASEIGRFADGTTPLDMLLAWNRTTIHGQRVRMVLGTNPGGPGEEWIIEYWRPWLDPNWSDRAASGELRWLERSPSGELVFHKTPRSDCLSYTFIASSWEDNPYTQPGYVSRINLIPGVLGEALRGGIWGLGAKEDLWQIIPRDWVLEAQARWEPRDTSDQRWTAAGLDVARGGTNSTVLSLRQDSWYDNLHVWSGAETPTGSDAADVVSPFLFGGEAFQIYVDSFGVGADCYGELHKRGIGDRCVCFFGNEPSQQLERNGQIGFNNVRTEALWLMREALDPIHGDNLALPPSRRLLTELTAYRYKMHSRGYAAEAKQSTIDRLGSSPDEADAVVMANYAAKQADAAAMFSEIVRSQPADDRDDPRRVKM